MSHKATSPAAVPLPSRSLAGLPAPQTSQRAVVACAAAAPLPELPSSPAEVYAAECAAELQAVSTALEALQRLRGPQTVLSALEPYNDLAMLFDRALNRAGLYQQVHPDAAVRLEAQAHEQRLAALATQLELSTPVYEALASMDVSGEDARTQRYVRRLLESFRRSGVDRDPAVRAQVQGLKETLVQLGQAFSQNIVADERSLQLPASALAGLPADYVAAHPVDAVGQVTLTTRYPDINPFLTYAQDDAARKALATAFAQRGYPANAPVLEAMLSTRHALAQLLGYPSWAAQVTEDKMIGSVTAAQRFIGEVTDGVRADAQADYERLLARLRQDDPDATAVGDWQKAYLSDRLRREALGFDAQALREYFSFGRVQAGLFQVASQLFGVRYRRAEVPVWHPSVEAYDVLGAYGPVGRFYLDLHPRADKYNHAAMFQLVSGVRGRQLPEATLVCNFPQGDQARMEHREVETFFHEFGHLMHHILGGQQRWVEQSGVATEWDFVEAPSQLLEEWTYDREVLKSFARNAAGEPIPDALIDSLLRARSFGQASAVQQQMFQTALSLQLHAQDPRELGDLTDYVQGLRRASTPFTPVPDSHFHLSFGHLEGYSALYYTYMWSKVIAKDMFAEFEAAGVMNPEVARRYREAVLEPGGSADAKDLVRNFLGREFTTQAFADWLKPRP